MSTPNKFITKYTAFEKDFLFLRLWVTGFFEEEYTKGLSFRFELSLDDEKTLDCFNVCEARRASRGYKKRYK